MQFSKLCNSVLEALRNFAQDTNNFKLPHSDTDELQFFYCVTAWQSYNNKGFQVILFWWIMSTLCKSDFQKPNIWQMLVRDT